MQPLIVQKKGNHYEIIAGERRWRAAKLAGVTDVPVLIREYDKQQLYLYLWDIFFSEDMTPFLNYQFLP